MRLKIHFLAFILTLAVVCAPNLLAAPAPSLTFYGMLVDEFGWPYVKNVTVTVSANGLVVLSKSLQPAVGKNYNFIFRIPYDTGVVEYSSASVTAGDSIDVTLSAADTGNVLIHRTLTVTSPPGTVVNINLTSGVDSVGDGLPDALRYWIWQSLGLPGPFDPKNIKASDDSDGDGVSNLQEYLAGTDPANAADVFKVTISPSGVSDVSKLNFFSVPGKTYEVQEGRITPLTTLWSPALFGATPTEIATNSYFLGTGQFATAFVRSAGTNSLFRLSVSSPPAGARIVP